MAANLRYFLALIAVNMKAARSLRTAYIVKSLFNILQHSVYIVLWFFIFETVPSIGGWRTEHILLAYGIGIMVWGLVSFFAYGLRTLPKQIDRGELDTYLTQPRPVLLNVAMGTTQASGPAEILFGALLMGLAAYRTDVSIPALFLVISCSFTVFCSIILSFGSLGFWLKDYHQQAEEMNFNFFILSNRPAGVFQGWLKIATMTVVPVAFMTHIPLEYLVDHKIEALWTTLGGTVACSTAALTIFRFGLSHYESGNRFGVRG